MHRTFFRVPLVILALFTAHVIQVKAQSISSDSEIKVLTIGNSFADNSTQFLAELAASQGVNVKVGKANIGGSSMELHAGHLATFLKDPQDPDGSPYRDRSNPDKDPYSLIDALKSDDWNFVTIQQLSRESFKPESYEPYASQLVNAIRKYAPQAEILVHQTWAYRTDSPFFEAGILSQQSMYERLTAAYDELAERYGLRVIPVGDAFQIARAMPRFYQVTPDPDFDYDNPSVGELPNQKGSMVAGWYWRKNKDTEIHEFRLDANHANVFGKYLGACAFYEVLTGIDSRELNWYPKGLSDREAEDLRHATHKAVATRQAEESFVSIFNGKNFDGWEYDPRYWRVEDGVMVGEVTPELILKRNSFMIWQGGSPTDFELKVEYRVSREGNSGLSYRNIRLEDAPYSLSGYQADIDGRDHDPRLPRQRYVGQAWEERGRGFLARRGQVVQMDQTGQSIIVGSLGGISQLETYVKDNDWNEYHLIIRGNVLIHMINGQMMSMVIDNDPVNRRMEGLIGVQVHTGPPQKIEFRNFRLKELN